jgi:hypothetical protein
VVDPWLGTLGALAGAALQMFVYAYALAGPMLVFRDAREFYDGRGLEARIAGLPEAG